MVKEQTLTSIDDSLKRKAKDAGLNFSAVLEKALKEKLGAVDIKKELGIIDEERCSDCGNIGPRETRETIGQDNRALTWLCPEEVWICNSCLDKRISIIGVKQ